MPGHPYYYPKRYAQRNEGNPVNESNKVPPEVVEAAEAVIACGKEVILRKEHGLWVVLENGRRLVYKEKR